MPGPVHSDGGAHDGPSSTGPGAGGADGAGGAGGAGDAGKAIGVNGAGRFAFSGALAQLAMIAAASAAHRIEPRFARPIIVLLHRQRARSAAGLRVKP